MKKILALLLSICLLVACYGCDLFGGSNEETPSKKTPSSSANDSSDELSSEDEPVTDDTASTSKRASKGSVSLSGETGEDYIIPEDDEDYNANYDQVVESGTSVSTLKTPWDKITLPHLAGSSDAEATAMRNKVLSSKNTAEIYNITGTKYYVSPKGDDKNDGKSPAKAIKTTTAIYGLSLKKGDAVLFERGGVWRLSKAIKCDEGVTYGSYGTGEKPAVYGSMQNYADKKFWTATNLKNVWKLNVSDIDIGLMVFDHGEIIGYKTKDGLLSLRKNGDFYYNRSKSLLYIYCDGGNPGKVYKDIEVCLNKAAFDVNRVSGVTIDNFKIKYFGRLGVDLAAADNSAVTNCEVGFIGGALQNATTRLGNAIQMWQGCNGHRVENCWTYQIYDTGLTFQGDSINPATRAKQGTHEEDYLNITYKDNLVEYCALSIEIWHGNHNDGKGGSYEYTDAVLDNIHVEGNISRFAGYGWSSFPGQRPDPHGEHLILYAHAFPYANNAYIEDNIFDLADAWICRWQFTSNYKEDTNDATRKKINGEIQPIVNKNGIWTIRNNTYYHGKNRSGGINWYGGQKTGSGQSTLETVVKSFDQSPKKVVWIS